MAGVIGVVTTFTGAFIEFISVSDYDIAGGVPVGRVIPCFSATPAASPPWQFRREGVTPGINIRDSGTNCRFIGPHVRIEALSGLR